MQEHETLDFGKFYHIYNHGVGHRDLFRDADNYENFLSLWDKYICPVADTYAWVLMKNHFHALVRIKEGMVYKYSNADRSVDAVGFKEKKWQTVHLGDNPTASGGPVGVNKGGTKIPQPHLHFSHLFNAYSKYFNTRYETHGALFERPFQHKIIDNKYYLKRVILYIHNNPVHHGFCSHPVEYPWCSYLTCVSIKPTKLHRATVMGWFDGEANFKTMHDGTLDVEGIEGWLGI